MPTKTKQFFEVASHSETPTVLIDGGSDVVLNTFTTCASFEFLQSWNNKKPPSSAQLYAGKPWKNLPDLLGEDVPLVTARFKSVIEAMAPTEVEFRSFSLRWQADQTPVPGEWYLCNLLRRIDCIDFDFMGLSPPRRDEVERRTLGKRTDPMTEQEYWYREGMCREQFTMPIHVDTEAVGDAQIWRPRWTAQKIFITDKMLKAMKEAGIWGLQRETLGTELPRVFFMTSMFARRSPRSGYRNPFAKARRASAAPAHHVLPQLSLRDDPLLQTLSETGFARDEGLLS